ncbi:hypothetical protein [Pulveribacter sp.]|uniref:DUF7657 domain-containing protein n=1 Tax=Pulveribacter sp. TaxID=2678893 RepID=UPI00289B366C|nr:hypothetical protein [Pulveribacter sp.]
MKSFARGRWLWTALRWLSPLLLVWHAPSALALDPALQGAVDRVSYDRASRHVTVEGWAASTQPQVFITGMRVTVAGRTAYRGGRWQIQERHDVAEATQRPGWLHSGYRIVARVPLGVPAGLQTVQVFARLGNGQEVELPSTALSASIDVQASGPVLLPAWLVLGLLGLPALVVLAHLVLAIQRPALARWCGPQALACVTALAFVALVSTGTTGSSLSLLLQGSTITQGDAPAWLGQPRPIRSDEWEVITPMALSQHAHAPRYPALNDNLAAGGQNMLVVGMSGVPVAHVSTLAKPATWGFFVLPLPQALAWYWWLPFFGGFGALWLLLWRMADMDWRAASAWAAALAWSPYSAAFSGWPAYLLGFGAAGLLCAAHALRTQRTGPAVLYGLGLGLAVAGYALVLYPAWQISLGYLLAAYGLAWAWAQRRSLRWASPQWLALLAAAALTAGLLGAWWHDAAPAVRDIQATVYPGQRTTSVGGDIDPWYLIKGLLSPTTMYQTPPLMDASDAGSLIWLLIPLALLEGASLLRTQAGRVTGLALAGYIVFLLYYLYVGLPEPLARISLWGRAISYRMDLALGLAQVLLLAWLWRAPVASSVWRGALAGGLSLAAAAWCYAMLPPAIADALSPAFLWLSTVAWALAAWWLGSGRFGAATALVSVWMLATAMPFHPLARAPAPLELAHTIARHVATGQRVAVIGERRWSLLLPAAGVAVVNSVHYHPPERLWQQLDPQSSQAAVHNRYQRLLLNLQAQPEDHPAFDLHTPRLDEVVLTLDPARFSFALLEADHVLAPLEDGPALAANPGLEEAARGADWVLMRVRRGA